MLVGGRPFPRGTLAAAIATIALLLGGVSAAADPHRSDREPQKRDRQHYLSLARRQRARFEATGDLSELRRSHANRARAGRLALGELRSRAAELERRTAAADTAAADGLASRARHARSQLERLNGAIERFEQRYRIGRPLLELITPMEERYAGEERGEAEGFRHSPHQVAYKDAGQRSRYELRIGGDGTLYGADGTPYSSRDADGNPREAVIVLDPNGKLYASTEHRERRFHHSSLVAGGPVAFAGMGMFEEGALVSVNNQSGHYPGDKRVLEQFLRFLDVYGVSVRDTSVSWYQGIDMMVGMPQLSRAIKACDFFEKMKDEHFANNKHL